jgi:hypothetical protein
MFDKGLVDCIPHVGGRDQMNEICSTDRSIGHRLTFLGCNEDFRF